MTISFYFQKVNRADQDRLKEYFMEKKLNRLTRLLQHGNLALAHLRIHAEYFQRHNAFRVEMDLGLKKQILVAEERSHDVIKGLDLSLDRLIGQLRKIENRLHDK